MLEFLMGRKAKEVINGNLICSRCREEKPTSAFSIERGMSAGFSSFCKSCYVFKRIKAVYGINREESESIMENQRGSCAICGEIVRLVLDHCHSSGRVRGFLCSPCNTGLGFFRDLPLRLRRAAEYLEKQVDTRK